MDPKVVIDMGQTGSRARVEGSDVTSWGPPAASLVDASGAETVAGRATELVGGLGVAGIDSITIGMTGFVPNAELLRLVACRLLESTCARSILVADDVLTGYLGAIGPISGVVVTAGTGSVALGVGPDHGWKKVGGHGHLLGDVGSGFWIGRQGLRAALESMDGAGGSTVLAKAMTRRYEHVPGLRSAVYGSASPVAEVASFAPAVTEAAGSGDKIAAAIVARAARHLAHSAMAAHLHDVEVADTSGVYTSPEVSMTANPPPTTDADSPGTPVPIALTGGLSRNRFFLSSFAQAMASLMPSSEVRPASGSPLDGAEILSRQSFRWHLAGLVACFDSNGDIVSGLGPVSSPSPVSSPGP